MATEVHTFPVPRHMTAEEAWFEIQTLGEFHDYKWWHPKWWWRRTWASMEVEVPDAPYDQDADDNDWWGEAEL